MGGTNEMIRGFQAGDEDAVRALYQEYGGAVLTIARSMVRDQELSKEIVQQTFLKAWRSASSFDQTREFSPWLYAIARRTAIDVLRREQRKPPPASGGTSSVNPVEDLPDSRTMTFERTWEVFEVRRAIDALPTEEREVIRLSHLVGLSHPEISHKLGVPVGTVKSRSARGRKKLTLTLRHLAKTANQTPPRAVEGDEE